MDSSRIRRSYQYRLAPRRQLIDGVTVARRAVTRPRPQPTSVRSGPTAPAVAQQRLPRIRKKQFTAPAVKTSRWKRLQMPLIICGAAVAGFCMQYQAVGITVACIYGLCALWFHISSRTTFALAALSVLAVAGLLLFRPDLELAGNLTTYTFLLLVTGVITLVVESRPFKRRRGRLDRAG